MSRRLPFTLLQRRLDIWRASTPPSHFCEHENLERWLLLVHGALEELHVPEVQWVDAAMYLLDGRLKGDMTAREVLSFEREEPEWDWTIFETTLKRAHGRILPSLLLFPG